MSKKQEVEKGATYSNIHSLLGAAEKYCLIDVYYYLALTTYMYGENQWSVL